jgi:choline dehydrogenase-like flavoprotein
VNAPDVIVLGAGPGGVSAAAALTERGRTVLHLDAAEIARSSVPPGSYRDYRSTATEQWRLLLGAALEGLALPVDASPKYRVPDYARLFSAWRRAHPVRTQNFTAAGMLAVGGMTNAWGGGVARFATSELAACGLPAEEMADAYARVERRIGVSGAEADDIAPYFGPSAELQAPTALVGASRALMDGYRRRGERVNAAGLRLGRSRLALLTADRGDRHACAACNFCLYGCERRAIYNAAYEIAALRGRPGYRLVEGFAAERIEPVPEGWRVVGKAGGSDGVGAYTAARVVLACGALVSARLALDALRLHEVAVRLHCHPSAGMALLVPGADPRAGREGVAIGQVDYLIDDVAHPAYGSILPVDALPLAALLPRAPFGRAAARIAMRRLTPFLLAANMFLPSELSRCSLTLGRDGVMRFAGALSPETEPTFARLVATARRALALCRAWIVPGSFSVIEPGADLHYAGSLPHAAAGAAPATVTTDGEIRGLPGVHVVDGAALASLPAKPPALTIMANADRIARRIATRCEGARPTS